MSVNNKLFTFSKNILKIIIRVLWQCQKYRTNKSYHGRCCGLRKSQIQVHCKLSLTSAFGHGLVLFMEADYYEGWSQMRKVKLNLAKNIHCPILVSLSSVFALKKKNQIYTHLITDLWIYLNVLKVEAFFVTHKPGPNSSLTKNYPIWINVV